jgi:hypothetical protein
LLAIDSFIALDLISEDEATEALLYAAEAKARELKCLAIHIRVDATQKSIADRITARTARRQERRAADGDHYRTPMPVFGSARTLPAHSKCSRSRSIRAALLKAMRQAMDDLNPALCEVAQIYSLAN